MAERKPGDLQDVIDRYDSLTYRSVHSVESGDLAMLIEAARELLALKCRLTGYVGYAVTQDAEIEVQGPVIDPPFECHHKAQLDEMRQVLGDQSKQDGWARVKELEAQRVTQPVFSALVEPMMSTQWRTHSGMLSYMNNHPFPVEILVEVRPTDKILGLVSSSPAADEHYDSEDDWDAISW